MANYYIVTIALGFIIYITFSDTFIKQERWSVSNKRKFKRMYVLTWVILYLIYLLCVALTTTTKTYFIQHIPFGAFIHLVFALFVWKATIY
jgi:uncharacterized membrane protein SirB2